MGEFEPALEAEARARAIGEAAGDRQLQASASWASGLIYASMGEWEAGIAACQQGLEQSPDPLSTAVAQGWLGYAYVERGDSPKAIPLLEQAIQQLGQFRFAQFQGWFMVCLAEAHRLNGQIEEALAFAVRALAITQDVNSRYGAAWAQRALGRIAQAKGDKAEAETQLGEALRIFASIEARYDLGRTHLDLAQLAHAQGQQAEASTHLKEAHSLFVASRIPRYVERTEQLAKAFDVVLSGEPPAANV
jgi:tetratricopeptide (TPR) repeat protein